MALRANLLNISSCEDWQKFFEEELNLSPDIAKSYSEELTSQNITGKNITLGLSDPSFLNQFNMTLGHQLELKSKFTLIIKSEPLTSTTTEPLTSRRPSNKVPIPVIQMNVTQLEFEQFEFEWKKYKEHYQIIQNAATSLFFCCNEEVRQQIRILQSTESFEWTEEKLLEAIKLTVLSRTSAIIHIKQFLEMRQESNDTVQSFLQKLQTKASCCDFRCRHCNNSNMEDRIKEKFIIGLKDTIIQRATLKTESVKPGTPLKDLLTEALTLEQSIREQETLATSSAVKSSVFSVDEQSLPVSHDLNAINHRRPVKSKATKCSHCGSTDHSSFERREKCPAWGKRCNNCQILHHFKNMCLKPKRNRPQHQPRSVDSAEILFIGEISSILLPVDLKPLNVSKHRSIDIFPDTGANICLMGPPHLRQLGIKRSQLTPCFARIAVAGGSMIISTGWTDIEFKLGKRSVVDRVYFSKRASRFFLSRESCRSLNIIPESFPYPPDFHKNVSTTELKCADEDVRKLPTKPHKIPFKPIQSNIPALKKFLLDSFSQTTFNKGKPFPKLSTPPAHIHLKPDHIVPRPAYWPATVADHWAEEVKSAIESDVEAGILEKVPLNEPTQWCSRMVVVRKKDGRPRRTVDYQQLNKQCMREPNHCESPFHTAQRIPEGTWKTVVDAVDGYHSVEIDQESSKLTTFITPWGRFRYLRFPQGHCAAGDAFNGRFQLILSSLPRFVRIVDDVCIYDYDIEQSFWHTWDLLTTCSENGIVLNKSKFQFCSLQVDFAGLTVTQEGVRPSTKILTAIQDFPPPKDLTQARAFFGLINQVQWAYANSKRMAPFRDLVKPNGKFCWTEEHLKLFEESKQKILQQVVEGVRQFTTKRATCIQTDFSQEGIGYLLLQKFCQCSMDKAPLCCKEGWKLVFAGSRFTKGAEARYSPTHGEALAVAWALDHARMFTRGCPNLIISTDHMPLLGILNDKPMESIKNPRIVRMKEDMAYYNFILKYNAGKWHRAPDALSRNPVSQGINMLSMFTVDDDDELFFDDIDSMLALAILGPQKSLTLEDVRRALISDPEMIILKSLISNGFGSSQHSLDPSIRNFFNVKDDLWIEDEIIMFKNRVVIPKILRPQVLHSLHSAHQGTEGMRARAANSVYWPRINSSIEQTRHNCKFCNSISPSRPRQPLQSLPTPLYPFQFVCGDAFEIHGHQYLVFVDKFSGWLMLFHFTSHIKGRNIVESLSNIFHTFGAPTKFYSDGGLPFVAQETQEFFQRWGVEHVISSAHYAQSNGRAELGVKTAKRMISENISPNGSLNTEAVSKALLQYRNTPIQGLGLSPAQILFHRNLRDSIPTHPELLKPHEQWLIAARNREETLYKRNKAMKERYDIFTKDLSPIMMGTKVIIQERRTKRWNKSGTVINKKGRKYYVKLDGSGRVTSRNRRFLRVEAPHAKSEDSSWNPSSPSSLDHEGSSNQEAGTSTSDIQHTDDPVVETNHDTQQATADETNNNTQETTAVETNHNTSNDTTSNDNSYQVTQPVPLMLRRLLPHNNPGINE